MGAGAQARPVSDTACAYRGGRYAAAVATAGDIPALVARLQERDRALKDLDVKLAQPVNAPDRDILRAALELRTRPARHLRGPHVEQVLQDHPRLARHRTGTCDGVPTGIRTRVSALKGPRPRPLDDGDLREVRNGDLCS